jgi:hypothetical protein
VLFLKGFNWLKIIRDEREIKILEMAINDTERLIDVVIEITQKRKKRK